MKIEFHSVKYLFISSLSLFVVACSSGGGGSSDENANSSISSSSSTSFNSASSSSSATAVTFEDAYPVDANWRTYINRNPAELTEQQLKAAYWGHAVDSYGDDLTPVSLDLSNYNIFSKLHGLNAYYPPFYLDVRELLADAGVEMYAQRGTDINNDDSPTNTADETPNIMELDTVYDCYLEELYNASDYQDTAEQYIVRLSGTLEDGRGLVEIDYENCPYLGPVLAAVEPFEWELFPDEPESSPIETYVMGPYYFDSVLIEGVSDPFDVDNHDPEATIQVTGYGDVTYMPHPDDQDVLVTHAVRALFMTLPDGTKVLKHAEAVTNNPDLEEKDVNAFAVEGLGSVIIEEELFAVPDDYLTTNPPKNRAIIRGGNNTSLTKTEFLWGYTLHALDVDGDGSADYGRFYAPWKNEPYESEGLVAYETLNFPPYISIQTPLSFEVDPERGVIAIVNAEAIGDLDTPFDELQFTVEWELMHSYVGVLEDNVLPPEYLQQGNQQLSATLIIDDGFQSIYAQEPVTQTIFWEPEPTSP